MSRSQPHLCGGLPSDIITFNSESAYQSALYLIETSMKLRKERYCKKHTTHLDTPHHGHLTDDQGCVIVNERELERLTGMMHV